MIGRKTEDRPGDNPPDREPARQSWITPLAASFALCGIGLRLYQYLTNRSLHIDEAALALNIRDRSLLGLANPLDFGQTAPLGYLWLEKLAVQALGHSEYVLRAPALLAGILSIPLFMVLARRILPSHLLAPAVALFALGRYGIYWASDMKPYTLDLVGLLILLLLALRFEEKPAVERANALGAAGALLPWFSLASGLTLAALAIRLAWLAFRRRTKSIVRIGGMWLFGLPALFLAVRSLGTDNDAYLHAFWAEGFLPLPWRAGARHAWWIAATRALRDPLGLVWLQPAPALVGGAIVAGLLWLVVKGKGPGRMLLLPTAATLAVSMAGRYPVTGAWTEYAGRVILFLLPVLCLSAVAGAAWIPHRRTGSLAAGSLALTAAVPMLLTIPWTRGDVRPVLEYGAEHTTEDDVVYMYYGMKHVTDWYRPAIKGRVVEGICAQPQREPYLLDLEQLRGAKRLWVLAGFDFYDEPDLLFAYMDANATLLDASDSLFRAQARLYDFSDSTHVPLAPALLEPLAPPNPAIDCRGIFGKPLRTTLP